MAMAKNIITGNDIDNQLSNGRTCEPQNGIQWRSLSFLTIGELHKEKRIAMAACISSGVDNPAIPIFRPGTGGVFAPADSRDKNRRQSGSIHACHHLRPDADHHRKVRLGDIEILHSVAQERCDVRHECNPATSLNLTYGTTR